MELNLSNIAFIVIGTAITAINVSIKYQTEYQNLVSQELLSKFCMTESAISREIGEPSI